MKKQDSSQLLLFLYSSHPVREKMKSDKWKKEYHREKEEDKEEVKDDQTGRIEGKEQWRKINHKDQRQVKF